jgi:hypothetical protein
MLADGVARTLVNGGTYGPMVEFVTSKTQVLAALIAAV